MAKTKLSFQLRVKCNLRGDAEKSSSKKRQNVSRPKYQEQKKTSKSSTSKSKSSTSTQSDDLMSKSTNWRHTLKRNDPTQYADVLKRAATYNRLERLEMSLAESTLAKRNITIEEREKAEKYLDKKKRYNATTAKRMRKLRAKKKEAQGNKKQKVPLTRTQEKAQEQKRNQKLAAEAKKKREKRAAMSQEAHEQQKANRREKYKQKKEMEKQLQEAEMLKAQNEELKKEELRLKKMREELNRKQSELEAAQRELEAAPVDARKPAARRKSLQRARSGMPRNPHHYVTTAVDLCDKASPRKVSAFKKRGIFVGLQGAHQEVQSLLAASISKQMGKLKHSKKTKDLEKRRHFAEVMAIFKKYRLQRKGTQLLNSSRKLLASRNKNSQHKKATNPLVKALVEKFYEENAINLPDKKLISKKTMKKTAFLQQPVSTLYSSFKAQNPAAKIGLKKFYSLRPKHIKLQHEIKYRGCLCEYCTNIELKVTAINKLSHSYGLKSNFQGVYGVNRVTLCPKSPECKYYKRECIERRCKTCGPKMLSVHLKGVTTKHGDRKMVWKKWERVTTQVKGKQITKQEIATKEGSLVECIKELEAESIDISFHLHNASWQNDQFQNVTKNIPQGSVVMVLDFAENFVCQHQDEIQSAHWFHSNVTIHPIVCYYHCPTCDEAMQESLIFITGDNIHDYHAVHHFMSTSALHLSKSIKVDRIIRFSDQCSAQYKSKGPFLDVAVAEEEYQIPVEHHYFGARHGKGPSDGETAVVKRQASTAITSGRKVINNAKDMYDFCAETMTKSPDRPGECVHFQRRAFFVEDNVIQHDRGHKDVDLRTIKGTRQLHCVKGNYEGKLWTRNLSCFCSGCTESHESHESQCDSSGSVDDWKAKVLFTRPPTITKLTCRGPRATSSGIDDEPRDNQSHDDEPHDNKACDDEPDRDASRNVRPAKSSPCDISVNESRPKLPLPSDASRPPKLRPSAAADCQVDKTKGYVTDHDPIMNGSPAKSSSSDTNTEESSPKLLPTSNIDSCYEVYNTKVGDYVAVIYDDTWWPGEVQRITGETYHINFLWPKGDNRFVWPERHDTDELHRTGIFTRLPSHPDPINNRHLGFDPQVAKSVTTRVNAYLQESKNK